MPRFQSPTSASGVFPLAAISGPRKIAAFSLFSLALVFLPFWASLPVALLLWIGYGLAGLSLPATLFRYRILLLFPLVSALLRFLALGDLQLALLNGLYLLDLLLLSLLFLAVTTPTQLHQGLRYFRVPATFALMFSIALQSLPLLQEKLRRIRIAQASRGSTGKLLPLLLPLLHGLFERARTLSISLESRGLKPDA